MKGSSRHAVLAGFLGLDARRLRLLRGGVPPGCVGRAVRSPQAPHREHLDRDPALPAGGGDHLRHASGPIRSPHSALFGIGMGGEWGVGASLAMEQAPRKWRGVLSGILQSGYSIGYLLAAIASRAVLPNLGWRWMFWLGAAPALLALYIRTKVPESEA